MKGALWQLFVDWASRLGGSGTLPSEAPRRGWSGEHAWRPGTNQKVSRSRKSWILRAARAWQLDRASPASLQPTILLENPGPEGLGCVR